MLILEMCWAGQSCKPLDFYRGGFRWDYKVSSFAFLWDYSPRIYISPLHPNLLFLQLPGWIFILHFCSRVLLGCGAGFVGLSPAALPCAQPRLPHMFPINKSNPQNRQEFLSWRAKRGPCHLLVGKAGGEEEEEGDAAAHPIALSLSEPRGTRSLGFSSSILPLCNCPCDPRALGVCRGSGFISRTEPVFPHGGEGEEKLGQISVILAFCAYWGREIPSMCSREKQVKGNIQKSIL